LPVTHIHREDLFRSQRSGTGVYVLGFGLGSKVEELEIRDWGVKIEFERLSPRPRRISVEGVWFWFSHFPAPISGVLFRASGSRGRQGVSGLRCEVARACAFHCSLVVVKLVVVKLER
jgi:hypothetical protein